MWFIHFVPIRNLLLSRVNRLRRRATTRAYSTAYTNISTAALRWVAYTSNFYGVRRWLPTTKTILGEFIITIIIIYFLLLRYHNLLVTRIHFSPQQYTCWACSWVWINRLEFAHILRTSFSCWSCASFELSCHHVSQIVLPLVIAQIYFICCCL